MKTLTLPALVAFVAGSAVCAGLSPRQIVLQSINNYDKDWRAALNFTYIEHDATKDAAGKVKTVEVSQVSVLNGTPYSRLIAKNGRPLSGEEAAKENEKYRKALSTRTAESPEQRARRVAKYQQERAFLHEIPDAFNIQLVGKEFINGRSNYVLQLTPKKGYVPKSRNARMFTDIEGKLWVDEQDLRWTKAEAEVTDTISIGWVLARIGRGAHIMLEQVKVDNEHWMPKRIDVTGAARIMLVKNRSIDEDVTFSDYKRTGTPPAGITATRR